MQLIGQSPQCVMEQNDFRDRLRHLLFKLQLCRPGSRPRGFKFLLQSPVLEPLSHTYRGMVIIQYTGQMWTPLNYGATSTYIYLHLLTHLGDDRVMKLENLKKKKIKPLVLYSLKLTKFVLQVLTLDVPLPKALQVCPQHALTFSHLLPCQLVLHL